MCTRVRSEFAFFDKDAVHRGQNADIDQRITQTGETNGLTVSKSPKTGMT